MATQMRTLYFCPVSVFLSFFSSPNLIGRRLDVYQYLHTWCGLSANLECRSEMYCKIYKKTIWPQTHVMLTKTAFLQGWPPWALEAEKSSCYNTWSCPCYSQHCIPLFWEEEWLVGGDPFYVKFWVNRTQLERNRWFSVVQSFHGEIVRRMSVVRKRVLHKRDVITSVTDRQTKKTQRFWSPWPRVKSEPHQTWHGDRGPRAHSLPHKRLGVRRIVSPLWGAENLGETRYPNLRPP